MAENRSLQTIFQPPNDIRENAYISSMEQYREMYTRSIEDPCGFWMDIANEFYWKKKPTIDTFMKYNFEPANGEIFIKWMQGAVTNVCYNVLDRIIDQGNGDKIAFYW